VAALRTDQITAPPAITAAFAATTRAAVGIIGELNRQIADLENELATHFETHPDADIYLSQPGLGVILGARVLGEFGDDPNRYTTAKSRKNYAGTSPLTVASGKKRAVLARRVRNRRLYDAAAVASQIPCHIRESRPATTQFVSRDVIWVLSQLRVIFQNRRG
jgi:transposase